MPEEASLFSTMKLSPMEISALDRHVSLIEQANKNRLDFLRSDAVAFTPGALLAVAVARFAYQVYQDYGRVAMSPEDIQSHFKDVARELAELEAGGEDSLSLDIYSRFRRDLVAAKKGR